MKLLIGLVGIGIAFSSMFMTDDPAVIVLALSVMILYTLQQSKTTN